MLEGLEPYFKKREKAFRSKYMYRRDAGILGLTGTCLSRKAHQWSVTVLHC